jgi:stage II sporulation protein D
VTRAEALTGLGRLVERLGREPLQEVRVTGAAAGVLRTEKRGDLPLASAPLLFAATASGPAPVSRLPLTRHEPVLIHLDRDGRLDYLESIRPFRTISDDRFSARASWEVKVSREDLSSRLSRVLSFGELRDLQVIRRGVSGRVAELDVVGSRGTSRLTGFNVRVALQLDETLFTIERQLGEDGRITGFVFAGRGWGHGVGLCQVGAFGMAVRGADHRQILAHYYTGARLEQLAQRPELLDSARKAPVR